MADEWLGKRIGHFRVLEKIGVGGMGVVYKALDEDLRRAVALKVLPPDFTGDPERRGRFLREARAAAALTHANIATVYEVGATGDRVFIAMELIDGESLRAVLASRALSLEETSRIARRILRALAKAHENGVVHRDLKPDNVMVTRDDEVKLLDFGLAKLPSDRGSTSPSQSHLESDDTDIAATQEGRVMGSPYYMSPEQASGRAVDHRTDLFSFGVVLYEMLTRRRPFEGSSMMEVVIALSRDEPTPLPASVPAELAEVVARCLKKAPGERYASAKEAMTALDAAFGNSSAAGRELDASRRSVPDAATQLEGAPPAVPTMLEMGREAPRAPPARTKRRWLPVLSLTLLAAAVFVGTRLRSAGVASAPSTTAAPSVVSSTAVTDLPLPGGPADAVAAYRSAMQSLRDGNTEACSASLREAVRVSPGMAAASLRLAFSIITSRTRQVTEAREFLQRAAALRATLTERDGAFLDALDPAINREPPDLAEYEKRLVAASERYPRDAELLYALGFLYFGSNRTVEALTAYSRAIEADPRFMGALRMKAQVQRMTGDRAGARASLEACLSMLPTATGCLGEQIGLDEEDGRCEDVERAAQQMVAADAKSSRGYMHWARASAYLGRPSGAVDELLKQTWARVPEAMRAAEEPSSRASLATLDGRFDDADKILRELEDTLAANSTAALHAGARRLRVELALERGDAKAAAHLARDFLSRQVAWAGSPDWVSVSMLWVERLGGALSEPEFRRARDAMIEEEERRKQSYPLSAGEAWALHYAVATSRRRRSRGASPPAEGGGSGNGRILRAVLGRARGPHAAARGARRRGGIGAAPRFSHVHRAR